MLQEADLPFLSIQNLTLDRSIPFVFISFNHSRVGRESVVALSRPTVLCILGKMRLSG
jgi:hypothetical protein